MKKTGNKTKLIVGIAAVFLVAMAIWIGSLVSKNVKLNKELDDVQNQLVEIEEQNAALDALVDEENETALMEEYARKSGYVYPDERVYIDGN
ncbi:MAG: septum formation initiator family protein [Clostridia bacterium]|nr:septum formation initiator family protein [Clostridia bacterium]